MGKILLKTIDVILTLLVLIALINWGTVYWLDFNIVTWLSFGMNWLEGIVYSIVSVLGSIWLLSTIVRLLK